MEFEEIVEYLSEERLSQSELIDLAWAIGIRNDAIIVNTGSIGEEIRISSLLEDRGYKQTNGYFEK